MSADSRTKAIVIATRGSTLALAQSEMIRAALQSAFHQISFELRIIKTTGDKMQTASLENPGSELGKGLFTKELEHALLEGTADLAVHSLKDLPTELPEGLVLGAITRRADARDVLIYRGATSTLRGFGAGATLEQLPAGAVLGTSSTRRQAQILARRPDLKVAPVRGNVGTRLRKLSDNPELDGLILAAAGLERIGIQFDSDTELHAPQPSRTDVPRGLRGALLELEIMLPCVGQGALGIECRANDSAILEICEKVNHPETWQCATAERAFLEAMGGGCQSPVAAYAELQGGEIRMRAVSFREGAKRAEGTALRSEGIELGRLLAGRLK
jgi:hydroxymethylbilane synthase